MDLIIWFISDIIRRSSPAIRRRTINIIEFRNVNGPFASVDNLLKVEGMTEAKIRDIRNFVKLEGMSNYRLTEITPKEGHDPESINQ